MDTFDQATRSKIMSRVKSKNTRLEERVANLLQTAQIKDFTRYADSILGKPDFIYPEAKITIFVDSCFWHGCPQHLRRPNSNNEYWEKKINSNVARDRKQRMTLRQEGWSVIRIWEHELKQPEKIIRKIRRVLRKNQVIT